MGMIQKDHFPAACNGTDELKQLEEGELEFMLEFEANERKVNVVLEDEAKQKHLAEKKKKKKASERLEICDVVFSSSTP